MDHREIVCVETRAAYGTLEDVCYWAKGVDENARAEMERAIGEAVQLLERRKDDVYLAVLKRLELVRDLSAEKVSAGLKEFFMLS